MLPEGSARLCLVLAITALLVPGSLAWATRRQTEEELARIIGVGRREVKGLPLSEPINVKLNFDLVGVMELNEEQGYMETTGWLAQKWYDPRLIFSSSRGSNLTTLGVNSEDIWRPDIELYNPASFGVKVLNQHPHALISSGGEVYMFDIANIRSVCDVSGQLANGNTVTCSMKFGSWIYHGNRINVQLDGPQDPDNSDGPEPLEHVTFDTWGASGQWDLVSATRERAVKQYSCCPNPFPHVAFNFTLTKRTL